MLSAEEKKTVEGYKKQGYFTHAQFVARDKGVFVQTLVIKEFDDGQMKCIKISETPVADTSVFGATRELLDALEDVANPKVKYTGDGNESIQAK